MGVPFVGILGGGFDQTGPQLSKSEMVLAFTQFLTRGTDRAAVSTSMVTLFDETNERTAWTKSDLVRSIYRLSYLNRLTTYRPGSSTLLGLSNPTSFYTLIPTSTTKLVLADTPAQYLVDTSRQLSTARLTATLASNLDVLGREGSQLAGLVLARQGGFYLNTTSADLARRLGGSLAFSSPVLMDQAAISR